jgi:hypothetical protein
MKKLVLNLVVPLSVISFTIFTKWWYALPVDAPDSMLAGFPLPFVCDGWHTSMSFQIFVAELVLDFLVYFLFWFLVIFCVNKFLGTIRVPKILTVLLLGSTTLILGIATLIAHISDSQFSVKRDFEMEVLDTGYKFIWQYQARPELSNYSPKKGK